MRYRYFVSLNTGTPAFQQYKTAAERDDLEAAGDALAQATDRPVTLDLVNYVNAQLDVRTALTARQIAAAANDMPLAAGGLRSEERRVGEARGSKWRFRGAPEQ